MSTIQPSPPVEANDVPLQLSAKMRLRSAIGFALALAIIAFALSRLEIDVPRTLEYIKGANPFYFAGAFLAYYCTFPLRGIRWRLLLQSAGMGRGARPLPSIRTLAGIVYLSWFANSIIPAKLGDAYRGYAIKQRTGDSFSTAMGTVVAERAFDTVILALLLLLSLVFIGRLDGPESDAANNIMWITVALLLLMAVGLGSMWTLRSHLPRLMPNRFKAVYEKFQHGTLNSFHSAPAAGLVTVAVWGTEAARMFLVMQALSLGLSFPHALFLSLANALLTVLPFTPGGLGLVEAGMVGLLLMAGVPKEQAVATAVLDRIVSYWSIVALGSLILLIRRRL